MTPVLRATALIARHRATLAIARLTADRFATARIDRLERRLDGYARRIAERHVLTAEAAAANALAMLGPNGCGPEIALLARSGARTMQVAA